MDTALGLFVFSLLILIHEMGHYVSAKTCGIAVPSFSIGMGKAIFSRSALGTEWRLSIIPIGGYIEIDDEGAANWKKLITYLFGPLASIFFPVLVVIAVCWFNHANTAKALHDLFVTIWQICSGTFRMLYGLFTDIGKTSSEVVGPVGIVNTIARSKEWVDYVFYGVIVSIAIGFSNLLPIPPLDGGRIVFILMDMLGVKVHTKVVVYASAVGICFLLALMSVGTYNDIFVR